MLSKTQLPALTVNVLMVNKHASLLTKKKLHKVSTSEKSFFDEK